MNKPQINVAVMGMGTVGTGVVKVLVNNRQTIACKAGAQIVIKKILDKDIEGVKVKLTALNLDLNLVTQNIDEIIHDAEVDIVVELMGGIHPAKEFILSALEAGKSVVTANKDLIAAHGKELFEAASRYGVDLYFEASVAGGIPIIRPLKECLAGNRIKQIMGIVNGTTNYILTKMTDQGSQFADVLKEAQDLGYAEADPTADVGGFDAARKIAILASIAFNTRVTDQDVYVEGITGITALDIAFAKEMGYVIKLLGITKEENNEVEVRVHPVMIPKNHPLAAVNDVYNAVFVEGDAVGKTMFFGRGAGELPTASAVVGDIVAIARNMRFECRGRLSCTCFNDKRIKPIGEVSSNFYLRLTVVDRPGVLANIASVLGNQNVSIATVIQKRTNAQGIAKLVLVTHRVKEKDLRDAMAIISGLSCVATVESIIRVEEES